MPGRFAPTTPAAAAAPSSAPAARAQALVDGLGAVAYVDIVIPRTQIAAKLRLVSRRERFAANAAARHELAAAGFPIEGAAPSRGADEQWDYELAVQVLAVALRDPANPKLALGSVEDWRDCDDDQIAALLRLYDDHAQRIDPLGEGAGLTELEIAELVDASKKKDITRLMDFGSRKLALYAITLASPPATSATPTS